MAATTAFLQSIPDKYRYIIIDTPPVLAASESLVLATMADASLVCVLRDVSRIDQIKKAYQRLTIAGGKPVGLVLNGVPTKIVRLSLRQLRLRETIIRFRELRRVPKQYSQFNRCPIPLPPRSAA